MKHSAALIFAVNDKRGCYTGFFRDIPKSGHFNHLDFLAAHALPGPGSKINCIIQKEGPEGEQVKFSLTKATPLSQIPGLVYRGPPIASLPRPKQWNDHPLKDAALRAIKMTRTSSIFIDQPYASLEMKGPLVKRF